MKKKFNKKKIFFLVPSLRGGGAEKVIINIVNNLSREKFEIGLIVIEKEGDYWDKLSSDIKLYCLEKSRARYAVFDLVKLLKKEKPDIILATVIQATTTLYLASFFIKGITIVNRVTNSIPKILTEENKIIRFLFKKALRKSDYLISISKAQKNQLVNLGIKKEKIKNIYNPHNLNKIKKLKNEKLDLFNKDYFNIVACGRLSKQKGFSYLIEAVKRAKREIPKIKLYILGKGPLEKNLKRKTKELNLEGKVKFLGFKDNPYKYMEGADLFVLSSLWEGFGCVLVEALTCEVPVISTDCEVGPNEILKNGEYGELVPTKNSKVLADKIIYLYKNPNIRKKYFQKAYKRVKDFDVNKIIREYENFFIEFQMRKNKKNKILYLTTTSKFSGAEKMLFELASRLDSNYEILVCTLKDDLEGELLDKLRKKSIKTDCIHLDKKWKIWKIFKLFKIIKEFNPDMLQTFLFFDNILGRVIGTITKVPIIISGRRNADKKRNFFRKWIDRVTFPFADLIISNNKKGKEILIDKFNMKKDKVKVIHNGIDTNNLKKEQKEKLLKDLDIYQEAKNEFVLGFIGRITEQKGLKYLIKAMRELEDVFLIIIGEGEKKKRLKKQVQRLGLGENIFFADYKQNGQKYMNAFDLFVLPSLWEGMPNVVLEAMLQEVPVIASDVGDVKVLLNEEYLFNSGKTEEIKNKILKLKNLKESEKQAMINENKKKIENKFSIEKMVEEYDKLYKNLIKNNEK